jgi:hypothetical protein
VQPLRRKRPGARDARGYKCGAPQRGRRTHRGPVLVRTCLMMIASRRQGAAGYLIPERVFVGDREMGYACNLGVQGPRGNLLHLVFPRRYLAGVISAFAIFSGGVCVQDRPAYAV